MPRLSSPERSPTASPRAASTSGAAATSPAASMAVRKLMVTTASRDAGHRREHGFVDEGARRLSRGGGADLDFLGAGEGGAHALEPGGHGEAEEHQPLQHLDEVGRDAERAGHHLA